MLSPRIILATIFAVGVLGHSTESWAKKSLNYLNLPPEIRQEIKTQLPFIDSEMLTLEQLDEVLRYLQLKPQFQVIRIVDDGGNTPYRLDFVRTRKIANIEIAGNKKLSDSEILNIFALKKDDGFDQQSVIEAGEKVRLAYRELGFFNAVVDIAMPPTDQEELIAIHLQVTENKQSKIHDIIFRSPNEELNKDLKKALKENLNSPFTENSLNDIQQKIRRYLKENRFVRAEVSTPNTESVGREFEVNLSYRLEKVEQYTFRYAGVHFLQLKELEKTLDLDNFYSGNPTVGVELSQKIRNYYLTKGYARAEVTFEETDQGESFQKKITFNINEGPQIKISKINMTGRFSKKESYYQDFIKSHSSRLISKGYYSKEDLDGGLKNLVLDLQNEGYLQAKLISTRTQYNKEKNEVFIYVNLDEGPLTKIEAVEFLGNQSFPSEVLLNITKLRSGPLKLGQIEEAITRLKEFYQDNGHIEMQLLNEKEDLVTYDETNTKASLHFKIYEGPSVRVAAIFIEGNDFTKNYVIEKELEFSKGDLLTPFKLNESVARLQRTGFFSSVEISTLEQKTNVSNRTVLITVVEREPGLFTLGAGATNERTLTLRGYTSVVYRNLLGTGRGLSLRLEGNYNVADIKYLEHRLVLGYLEPYLFGSRLRGRINVTRSTTVTDYQLRQVTEVKSTTYSLEKDFTSHILGIWDLWSLATIRDFGVDARYPYPTQTQEIATLGPSIDLDFRNNPFNPSKGTFTRWSTEYSSPQIGSTDTIEYWRSILSFTHYATVGEFQKQPVVWANQFRGGYLQNLSNLSNGGIPWDKKGFTLGGQSTIRGYESGTQEVFPNRADLGLSGSDRTYYLTTDSSMYLLKSELRFPVVGSLGGAVFYDGGSVQIKGLNFTESYRDSTGLGIRYTTPVGPLSLEMAWKLKARADESPWRIHLSIGTF